MANDFHSALNELESSIGNARKMPLVNQYICDRDELMNLLQILRDSLPETIQEATRVVNQEAKILQDARRTAENTLAEAESRARNVRMESEQRAMLQQTNAQQRADDTVAQAQAKADAILEEAEREAVERVSQSAITIRSKQDAEALHLQATESAERMRLAALDDSSELLKRVEEVVVRAANDLHAARKDLEGNR